MPLTFNETVPTVTDMLEYCEVPTETIRKLIAIDAITDFISEGTKHPFLDDIVLSDIDLIIKNLSQNKRIPLEKMKEFRKTTNSDYIAWM